MSSDLICELYLHKAEKGQKRTATPKMLWLQKTRQRTKVVNQSTAQLSPRGRDRCYCRSWTPTAWVWVWCWPACTSVSEGGGPLALKPNFSKSSTWVQHWFPSLCGHGATQFPEQAVQLSVGRKDRVARVPVLWEQEASQKQASFNLPQGIFLLSLYPMPADGWGANWFRQFFFNATL